jgi:2-polyprenyl-3-methyl-5-hydroxy-6-metoxy-1,4-benzoquinol methylase
VKSFETIARSLKPEQFDTVSGIGCVDLPLKHDKVFFHSGDFGDIIYALPTIRALGGGKLVIGPSPWKTRLVFTQAHVDILLPLLRLQPYIQGVEFSETVPPGVDVDLNRFREYLVTEHERTAEGVRRLNLAEAQLYALKLPLDECSTAWLTIDQPEPIPNRPVLIHRSARWRNSSFPWDLVMKRHGHQALFVGLESEHQDFVKDWGDLPFQPTHDFLELARLIAGCRLYIGNQSLPYAICEGLKHPSVLEVWPEGPNCLFNRKNAIYGHSRYVYIPKLQATEMNTTLTYCPVCGADTAQARPFRSETDIVQCQTCFTVYLKTRPDEEQTRAYYQHYADEPSHMRLPHNVEDIRSSGLRRDYFLQELMEFAQPPGHLLDIGCGWGAFLVNAREKGFTPYGVDVCLKAAHFSATILGIPTSCEDSDFPDEPLDVVTIIHTLEHLPDTATALKHIHARLRPGGLFCGIVPNIESFCSHARQEQWQWLDKNTHYVHFSPATLTSALTENGFELLRLYTHTGDYDQRELQLLLEKESGRPLSDAELADVLKEVWASGRGEEIRFFAKRCN